MVTKKNAMARLLKHEAAVKNDYNPYADGICWSSPGFNFLFGNTWLLPYGYCVVVYGPEKSGKTILFLDAVGQLHKQDDEAIALRYDTEFREQAQVTAARKKMHGIDPDRYVAYSTNKPEEIFDHIEKEVDSMCQDGIKIKFIAIDSVSMIQGRRAANAEGVLTQQRGDKAATIQEGLSRIWPVIHKHKIALYLTTHVRAEQDPQEQMRGNTVRMDGAWFLKHFAPYVIFVDPIKGKKGVQNLQEELLESAVLKDAMGKAERTGHRVRATMKGSSFGPKGRSCEFTFDYQRGIVNTFEEVYTLGVNRAVIKKDDGGIFHTLPDWPSAGPGTKWRGKGDTLMAIEQNSDLQTEILRRLKFIDVDLQEKQADSVYYSGETDLKSDGKADESGAE